LETSQGLSESEQIIASPPLGLVEGTPVIIAKPSAASVDRRTKTHV